MSVANETASKCVGTYVTWDSKTGQVIAEPEKKRRPTLEERFETRLMRATGVCAECKRSKRKCSLSHLEHKDHDSGFMSLMGTPENNSKQSFRAAASEFSIPPNQQPDGVEFAQATSTLPIELHGHLAHEAPTPIMPEDFRLGDPLFTSPERDTLAQTTSSIAWSNMSAQMFGYPQYARASSEECATIAQSMGNSTDGSQFSQFSQHCTYASSEGYEDTADPYASPTPSLTSSPPSPFDNFGMYIGDQFSENDSNGSTAMVRAHDELLPLRQSPYVVYGQGHNNGQPLQILRPLSPKLDGYTPSTPPSTLSDLMQDVKNANGVTRPEFERQLLGAWTE
ncbi:MAG: hypothetical protein Q9160_005875 [Pyrenula sp. 1 TL-2023]